MPTWLSSRLQPAFAGRCRARPPPRRRSSCSSAAQSSTTSGPRSRCSSSPVSIRSGSPGSGSRARPRSSPLWRPTVARARRSRSRGAGDGGRARGRLRDHERLLLPRDRPPPTRHGCSNRVLARHRPRGTRRQDSPERGRARAGRRRRLSADERRGSKASPSGSRSPSRMLRCSPPTSCSLTGSREVGASDDSTASGPRCSWRRSW